MLFITIIANTYKIELITICKLYDPLSYIYIYIIMDSLTQLF